MISAVITTWNEEKNIEQCVNSAKKIADEIIVVDTQSTDNTVKIAKKLGCKVYTHINTKIVEPVRNFSLSKASGDWVLLLDADEEISDSLAATLKSISSIDEVDYVRIPRKSIIFKAHAKSSHWWPDYVYRFFKKGKVIWSSQIHSIPKVQGKGVDLQPTEENAIIHYHYTSISSFLEKMNRYSDVQAEEIFNQKDYEFRWQEIFISSSKEFITQYFSREGYKNGLHGLSLSILLSIQSIIVQLKLWEKSGFNPKEINPKEVIIMMKNHLKDSIWWTLEKQQKLNRILKFIRKLHLFHS